MKKSLKILLIFALMVFSTPTLLAQGGLVENLQEVKKNITIDSVAISYLFMVLATFIATHFAKKVLNKTEFTPDWAVRALSQSIGVILTALFNLIGILALPWTGFFGVVFFGILAAITANGLFDTKIVYFAFSLFRKKS